MVMHKDPLNLIICGVGGQGNILASRIITRAMAKEGYFTSIGEVYGAAQRGGAVSSHIRISKENLWASVIPQGKAHIILAFEPLEALRVLTRYGSQETVVIANLRPVFPVKVLTKEVNYPSSEKLKDSLSKLSQKAWFIDATDKVLQLGARYLNMFMLGALVGTKVFDLAQERLEETMKENLPAQVLEVNIKALRLGMESVA